MKNAAHYLESEPVSMAEKRGHADKPSLMPGKEDNIGFGFPIFIPKSLHSRLAAQARAEGGSVNALVVELLAEGLTLRRGRMFKKAEVTS